MEQNIGKMTTTVNKGMMTIAKKTFFAITALPDHFNADKIKFNFFGRTIHVLLEKICQYVLFLIKIHWSFNA